MHNDDRPVGRALSRRELVGLFGASFAAAATVEAVRGGFASTASAGELPATAALAAQDCVAQPQQTEGPYFVDERLKRADIRRRSLDRGDERWTPRSTCGWSFRR